MEECSSIDTSDQLRSRGQTKILLRQCEYYTYSVELNNDDDVDTNDESRTRLHRPVLTIMQEGANQMINPCTGHDHRYFDNTDASKSPEEMNRKNSVNSKEFQDCKESRQSVHLQTPMELTLVSDSCDESRCRGNRCYDNDKCLATNKCVSTKQHSTLMGNQWLSTLSPELLPAF